MRIEIDDGVILVRADDRAVTVFHMRHARTHWMQLHRAPISRHRPDKHSDNQVRGAARRGRVPWQQLPLDEEPTRGVAQERYEERTTFAVGNAN